MLVLVEKILQAGTHQSFALTRVVAGAEWALEALPGVNDEKTRRPNHRPPEKSAWQSQLGSHSDEFRDGLSQHLVHHLAALQLDCRLAGTKFRPDLFVEQAGHDELHDFALAWRQRTETLTQLTYLCILVPPSTVARDRLLNRVQQFLVTKWLDEKFHGACF